MSRVVELPSEVGAAPVRALVLLIFLCELARGCCCCCALAVLGAWPMLRASAAPPVVAAAGLSGMRNGFFLCVRGSASAAVDDDDASAVEAMPLCEADRGRFFRGAAAAAA